MKILNDNILNIKIKLRDTTHNCNSLKLIQIKYFSLSHKNVPPILYIPTFEFRIKSQMICYSIKNDK